MRIFKQAAKVFIGFIGAAFMVSGALFVFVGVWDGFGNPAVWSRVTWVSGGAASLASGFYLFYLACERDVTRAIGSIFDAITYSLWP